MVKKEKEKKLSDSYNFSEFKYFIRKYLFYLLLISFLPVTIYATYQIITFKSGAIRLPYSLPKKNIKVGIQPLNTDNSCSVDGQCLANLPVRWKSLSSYPWWIQMLINYKVPGLACMPSVDGSCYSGALEGVSCHPLNYIPDSNYRTVCVFGKKHYCNDDGRWSAPGDNCGSNLPPPQGGGGNPPATGGCRDSCAICDYNDPQARAKGCIIETFCNGSAQWCWGQRAGIGENPPSGGGGSDGNLNPPPSVCEWRCAADLQGDIRKDQCKDPYSVSIPNIDCDKDGNGQGVLCGTASCS